MANIHLWVSWKKGPACWIKIGPTVMYLLCLTNYILIPLACCALAIVFHETPSENVYSVYTSCVITIFLLQMLFYFFTIKPFIYFNAMVYLARRKQSNERKALIEMNRTDDATVDFPQ